MPGRIVPDVSFHILIQRDGIPEYAYNIARTVSGLLPHMGRECAFERGGEKLFCIIYIPYRGDCFFCVHTLESIPPILTCQTLQCPH